MPDGDREHPIPRIGARVLLLDARDRALLFCIKDPQTNVAPFWTMPGGSIEAGESPEQTAVRELDEEVGLQEVALGPCIWRIRDTWSWRNRWYRSDQRVFLARIDAHEVAPRRLGALEQTLIAEMRWWSLEEVEAASDEVFVPSDLAARLRSILDGDIPPEPVDIGE